MLFLLWYLHPASCAMTVVSQEFPSHIPIRVLFKAEDSPKCFLFIMWRDTEVWDQARERRIKEISPQAGFTLTWTFFSSSFSLFWFVCLLRVGLSSFEIHRRSVPELWQRKLTIVHCGLKLQVKCIKLSPTREISCKATEEYLSMLIHLRWCVQTLHLSRHFLTSEFWTACFARGSYSSCEEYGFFSFLSVCIPYG